jgi:hypothetical protein
MQQSPFWESVCLSAGHEILRLNGTRKVIAVLKIPATESFESNQALEADVV